MSEIYFARHGETDWNVAHKICGRTDVPLNENGKKDALMLAQKILDDKIKIDAIFYSPLKRTCETALIVSQKIGVKAQAEELLIERHCGEFEGKSNQSEEFLSAQRRICDDYSGGESMLRVCARIFALLDRLKNDDRTLLLIGHNGIARSVEAYFNPKLSTDGFIDFRLKNCELRRYSF